MPPLFRMLQRRPASVVRQLLVGPCPEEHLDKPLIAHRYATNKRRGATSSALRVNVSARVEKPLNAGHVVGVDSKSEWCL